MKTAQESVKTGHVYLNIYSDKADGEIGIIASMFKEMADAFSQIEGKDLLELSDSNQSHEHQVKLVGHFGTDICLRYKRTH